MTGSEDKEALSCCEKQLESAANIIERQVKDIQELRKRIRIIKEKLEKVSSLVNESIFGEE